ncbi:hypothetical protein [Mucilaginibacter sp. CSA2-8R]|uniref:hypothetical protein n=1 Tax=Mucilaginibacter sp. CSA2-8R TaxID=3141542 RepID=UPI00315D86B1
MLPHIKSKIYCLLVVSGLLLPMMVMAQKSTDISTGVKVPATVKVDGKLTEWGTLPAYNKSTSLHYTLANDANNLYLAINATDQTTINKILGGGIILLINKDGKKREKDAVEIIYPMGGRGGMRGMRMGGRGGRQGDNTVDTAALVATRKQAVAGMKELSVTGIKDITDTLVSIYNTYGIKTGINIDAHGNFNYELAIPLKLLELDPAKNTELAYNIKVNGITMGGGNREGGRGQGGGRANGGGQVVGMVMISEPTGGGMMDMMTPTDFWGKYKLAKP